jgi:hypothetical protein
VRFIFLRVRRGVFHSQAIGENTRPVMVRVLACFHSDHRPNIHVTTEVH